MKVLVISAHPDDETLGCGGTILKHRAAGDEVHWLVMTTPAPPRWEQQEIDERAAEVGRVAAAYGVAGLVRLDLPPAGLDTVPEHTVIDGLRDAINEIEPETVYSVFHGDVHSDHTVTFRALEGACKQFRTSVKRIICYETISSTDAALPKQDAIFVPNIFYDITPYLQQKLAIMRLYTREVQEANLPRSLDSIKALARYRGSIVGKEYAEAFMLMREVG